MKLHIGIDHISYIGAQLCQISVLMVKLYFIWPSDTWRCPTHAPYQWQHKPCWNNRTVIIYVHRRGGLMETFICRVPTPTWKHGKLGNLSFWPRDLWTKHWIWKTIGPNIFNLLWIICIPCTLALFVNILTMTIEKLWQFTFTPLQLLTLNNLDMTWKRPGI